MKGWTLTLVKAATQMGESRATQLPCVLAVGSQWGLHWLISGLDEVLLPTSGLLREQNSGRKFCSRCQETLSSYLEKNLKPKKQKMVATPALERL